MRPRAVFIFLRLSGLGPAAALIASAALLALILARAGGSAPTRAWQVDSRVITVAIGAEPIRLDPHDARDAPSSVINYHIYDRLVDLGPNGEIVAGLARSWQVSADGKEYTFTLQPGVVFHDGLPLNASAVVANLERLTADDSTLSRAELIRPYVAEVTALDEETVSIRLHRPVGPFLRYLAHESLGIVSPASIEKAAKGRGFEPVGTGPFSLHEWTPGEKVALAAFSDHWRGAPEVEWLIFKPIPDGSGRMIALETGVADVAYPIDPVHLTRLRQRVGIKVVNVPSQRVIYAAFNLSRSPFDDPDFRRALNYAIDVEAIARHLLFDLARPLDSPLARATWGSARVSPYRYDPEKARELMADRRPKRPLELWSPSSRYVQDREVAQAIAGYLQAVGLDVRIHLFEWGTYLALLQRSDSWDIAILGWVPSSGEADMGLRPLYRSGSRGNHSGYSSTAVDALLDEAIFVSDDSRRTLLYQEAQAAIAGDAPALFLYSIDLVYAHRSEIDGVIVHSTEIVDLRQARRLDAPPPSPRPDPLTRESGTS